MEERRSLSNLTIDSVIKIVLRYITDSVDCASATLVCREWYEADRRTREHVTVPLCYSVEPHRLTHRFPQLTSLKLKGKPRAAAMFNLLPENWGAFVTPWIKEIATKLPHLKSVHLRRMFVSDLDLYILASAREDQLEVVKLDKCSGFSTDGLLAIAQHCRKLKTLLMEGSTFLEKDGFWLHELALHNSFLEVLNFYMVELAKISLQDLEAVARNCRSLVSLKIGNCEDLEHSGLFQAAANLEEFCGGSFQEDPKRPGRYLNMVLPRKVSSLGLSYMGPNEVYTIFPFAAQIRKLDLRYALLGTEDHCTLIQKCPNLEVIEAKDRIGDRGLQVLARNCKKLTRLKIDRDPNVQEEDRISCEGLIAVVQGCQKLEYLALHIKWIHDRHLELVGAHLENLSDLRLFMTTGSTIIFGLRSGFRELLRGCKKLRRFALCLIDTGLSDTAMMYIGQYGQNLRRMLLGHIRATDNGLLLLSMGCRRLQELEIRGVHFSENAIAAAAGNLDSLRYLWAEDMVPRIILWPMDRPYWSIENLLAVARPFWNIELIPTRRYQEVDDQGRNLGYVEYPAQVLMYFSLAGQRIDFPRTVRLIGQHPIG